MPPGNCNWSTHIPSLSLHSYFPPGISGFFSAGGRARGCFRSNFTLHSRNPPCSPAEDITKKVISSEDWKVKVLVTQSCLTLRKPIVCSPPGSSVHLISQARVLEWVAITFSRGSSRPRDQTQVFAWQADSLLSECQGSPVQKITDLITSISCFQFSEQLISSLALSMC